MGYGIGNPWHRPPTFFAFVGPRWTPESRKAWRRANRIMDCGACRPYRACPLIGVEWRIGLGDNHAAYASMALDGIGVDEVP